jgi:hypothetical protein
VHRFAVSADITPVAPSTSCDCCEYRQFIRKVGNYRTILFNGQPTQGWYPRRPNAADKGTHCDTWAEDSDMKPVLTVPLIEISYGYRQPKSLFHQP